MQGQGGYGPALANNPLITQAAGVDEIIRNGRGKMPPVADSWTDQQVNALITFMKTHIYEGAGTSGG
jgi:mono/diheme cytochrome c family protein